MAISIGIEETLIINRVEKEVRDGRDDKDWSLRRKQMGIYTEAGERERERLKSFTYNKEREGDGTEPSEVKYVLKGGGRREE